MVEPAVCVPNASGTIASATAAADPLEEPPGECDKLCGFRVGPGIRKANSVVTVFPMIMAPARLANATHAASAMGRFALIDRGVASGLAFRMNLLRL